MPDFEKPKQLICNFDLVLFPVCYRLNNNSKALLNTLSSSFDRGQKDQFFQAWQMLIPQDMLRRDFLTKKLEFYLHLYFVVYIFHPYNN